MAENTKRMDISELDFDNIKNNLKTFLRAQDTFKDYDFEGSGMNILLDVLAYNTHYQAFNANMLGNEMFLDSSSLRSSAVSHAKTLGYEVRSATAPYATVNVVLNSHSTTTATMPAGTKFTTTLDGNPFQFVTAQDYTETLTAGDIVFNNVTIYEGSYIKTRYTVDTNDVNQRFVLEDARTDTTTLKVEVQTSSSDSTTSIYTKATDITQLTGSSEVYFLQEVENGKHEVYFGDGVVSKALTNGNIVILSHIVTNKSEANGSSTFTNSVAIASNTNVTVTTVAAATGGAEPESISSIKFAAPLDYASQGRCVTTDDYVVYTKKFFADAKSVQAFGGQDGSVDPTLGVVSTPEYGKVFISIRTGTGNNLSLTQKNNLISQLKQYNVASITPVIVDPDVTQIILQIVFKFDSSKTIKERTELETNVTSTLTTYNIDELTDFVKPFRHSKLTRLVDTTDQAILNSTINVTLAKFITPTLNSSFGYNTSFNNALYNPHSGHNASAGGILASTGFYVSGDASNVQYFDDDGAGKLRRYYLTGSTRTYQDNAAGTIDYATGEIVINSINITSCADVDGVSSIKFRLTVIPDSKDVVPVRNQVLEIDLANSTVTGQVDTIAVSGADGGSTYTTTSSKTDIQSY